MIKQNEIKVLLMANVHGGNLHHPDTEAITHYQVHYDNPLCNVKYVKFLELGYKPTVSKTFEISPGTCISQIWFLYHNVSTVQLFAK